MWIAGSFDSMHSDKNHSVGSHMKMVCFLPPCCEGDSWPGHSVRRQVTPQIQRPSVAATQALGLYLMSTFSQDMPHFFLCCLCFCCRFIRRALCCSTVAAALVALGICCSWLASDTLAFECTGSQGLLPQALLPSSAT